MKTLRVLCGIVMAVTTALSGSIATAADTSSAIRIVVPYGPGGGTDILARLIAPKLTQLLKQPVVVENKGGAGSRVGTDIVAKAAPDGLTVLMVDSAFTTNPSLYSKLPYDSARDLEPVSLLATAPVILVVNPSMPVQNLREFIALGKKGPLQSASAGPGSATSLGTDLLASAAGITIQQIPYKGVGPAMSDVVGGQVPIIVTGISSAKGLVDTGKLRAIAVSGSARAPAMPDVPTFTEAGLNGVDASSFWGALVPAGTPMAAKDRLSKAMASAVRMPDVVARLHELGFNPIGGTPEDYRVNIKTESERWAAVIKATGVKLED
jgi:tripartite-type tricarboxylate transporter receptor subunit TctC